MHPNPRTQARPCVTAAEQRMTDSKWPDCPALRCPSADARCTSCSHLASGVGLPRNNSTLFVSVLFTGSKPQIFVKNARSCCCSMLEVEMARNPNYFLPTPAVRQMEKLVEL